MSILAASKQRRLDVAVGAAVVSLAFLLYFLTAARDIVVGDTPELITAAVTLGVAHPPGYPLFTMLGHLFSLLPLGPIPFRVNLLAVTCDALAVGVVYLTALRLSGNRIAAAIAALVLAVNPIFWAWSLVGEVFSLNNLLASLLIYLLVRWHERPERTGFLIGAFFVMGLALTNHQTIVLLAPAFCFVLWRGRAVLLARPEIPAVCAAAFFVGLLPYAYVPWASARHPAYNWGNVSSFRDLLALIARRSYGSRHLVSVAGYAGGSAFVRIFALCVSFGAVAGVLAFLGAIFSYRNLRWYFWFSAIAFVCVGPFFVSITNLNLATAPSALFVLQRFFLLSQVVLAPSFAFGVLMIVDLIADFTPARLASPLRLIAITILIALLLTVLTNYRRTDQSHNFIARSFGEDLFATCEPGTILFGTGDGIVFPLIYLQTVERMGQDTTLVVLPLLPADWYLRQLREHHPDLNIPFDHYDTQNNNLKMLVEANNGRPFAIPGTIGNDDRTLNDSYWPYQHGLVTIIEPKSKDIPMQELVRDNERLLSRYRPPAPQSINAKSFESDILRLYAWPAVQIGNDYAQFGLKREARAWYERALALDPDAAQAREGLARLPP